jgi:hypothetical protein
MTLYEQYFDYLFEREGIRVITHPNAFALVKPLNEQELYLQDVYVDPVYRSGITMKRLYDKIVQYAQSNGYLWLITTHDCSANNVELGLQNTLRYGFKITKLDGTVIVCAKDLGEANG